MMKHIFLLLIISFLSFNIIAGYDASGSIPYKVDLSQKYSTYTISVNDKKWVSSLVKRFKYKGEVIHFVKTSIPLEKTGSIIKGAVYQSIELPDYFYVVNGDVMLKIGAEYPYSPGVGGFSMHAKKTRNFIVSLNFQRGGVPFLSGSKVSKGVVTWKGDEYSRLK